MSVICVMSVIYVMSVIFVMCVICVMCTVCIVCVMCAANVMILSTKTIISQRVDSLPQPSPPLTPSSWLPPPHGHLLHAQCTSWGGINFRACPNNLCFKCFPPLQSNSPQNNSYSS